MGLDIKKVLLASILIIGIGIVLDIFAVILELLPMVVSDIKYINYLNLALNVFSYVSYPIFFAIFLWAGFRAVKKYGLDLVGAGTVSALSYFVIALFLILLDAFMNGVMLNRAASGVGFGSYEIIAATTVFGDLSGLGGVMLTVLCGIGIVIIGTLVNFVVGGIGGYFASRRNA